MKTKFGSSRKGRIVRRVRFFNCTVSVHYSLSLLYTFPLNLFLISIFCLRLTMQAQGIDPSGPEAQIFGRRLVRDLTEAFGACILLDGQNLRKGLLLQCTVKYAPLERI